VLPFHLHVCSALGITSRLPTVVLDDCGSLLPQLDHFVIA
jgi:hypothetical protein